MKKSLPTDRHNLSTLEGLPDATKQLLAKAGFTTIKSLREATDEQIAKLFRGKKHVMEPMLIVRDVREYVDRFMSKAQSSQVVNQDNGANQKPAVRLSGQKAMSELEQRLERTQTEITRLERKIPEYQEDAMRLNVLTEEIAALRDQADQMQDELNTQT